MKLETDQIRNALATDGFAAGISIQAELEPLGGPGAAVKPAVYAGGHYQLDKRWVRNAHGDQEKVDAVVIDNVPSQANRMEAALLRHAKALGIPIFELDLSSVGALPPHVSSVLYSLEFPHRHADAYLRDAIFEDGTPFGKSEIGSRVLSASATNPLALLEWFPASFTFGFWQSHLGKKAPQTKFARAFDSEIVGIDPATVETRRLGLKGDPLNLSISDAVSYDEDSVVGWKVVDAPKSTRSKEKESLAEIGHGQVPVSGDDAPLGAISFRGISQSATLSFARLRTITSGEDERDASMRAVLAMLGLVAYSCAFSGGFTLRSGCDLRTTSEKWIWRGDREDIEIEPLGVGAALELFAETVAHAEQLGLPVGKNWASAPIRLIPNDSLTKVLVKTFGLDK